MLVKVWNENTHPYTEKFRNVLRVIEPKSYIEMDEDEAEYFLAKFTAPVKDAQNRPDPRFFKKLRIERSADHQKKQDNQLVCHANGQKAATAQELKEVLSNFTHMLADKDDTAEAEALKVQNKELKKENKVLKSRLEIIEEKLGLRTTTNAESV
jgi:hypothetical protein